MSHKEKIRLIREIHKCLKPFDLKERRQMIWCMLMGNTVLKSKEGTRWLKQQFEKFVKNEPC